MTVAGAETREELACHRCGYDLRVQPAEGRCPECDTPVAESREVAKMPVRPAWGESDPRWRRRMVAGMWLLAAMPGMDVLLLSGWAGRISVPTVVNYYGRLTLDETLLGGYAGLWSGVVFCMGAVLLFTSERGVRASKAHIVRRWGVICAYVVAILQAALMLFTPMLVLTGIAACFLSMPLRNRHPLEGVFVEVSTSYLRYGPHPGFSAGFTSLAVSSVLVGLACVPIYTALRSIDRGKHWLWAAALPGLLAISSVITLGTLAPYGVAGFFSSAWPAGKLTTDVASGQFFGSTGVLSLLGLLDPRTSAWLFSVTSWDVLLQQVKWMIVVAIAVRLTVAQVMVIAMRWRRGRRQAQTP